MNEQTLPVLRLSERQARLITGGGILLMALGVLVLTGWVAGIPALSSFLPGYLPAKATTGLCGLLSGTALLLLQRPGRITLHLARTLIIAAGVIALTVFTEHLSGRKNGIDGFFLTGRSAIPSALGLMSLPATICFSLASGGLWLISLPRFPLKQRTAILGLLGTVILTVTGIALFSNLAGFPEDTLWGRFSSITLPGTLIIGIHRVDHPDGFLGGGGKRWRLGIPCRWERS